MDTGEQIAALEWELFDKVHNRGGRAACQDDKRTFFIMRMSQFSAWTEDMRRSWLDDLRAAQAAGRNPLAEKYGYMMARTSPAEYEQIKDQLPPRTAEKDALIASICAAHVGWLEELAARYPNLTGRGRAIRRAADSPASTSLESYLWGELATYSHRTLALYADHAARLLAQGRNMNEEILLHTVQQYGFASLDEAEAQLASR